MAKYDLESFMADVQKILSSYLNAKISAIDSEKGAFATGAQRTLDTGAYFFQELGDVVDNFNPYILYSIEALDNPHVYGASAWMPTVHVVLVLADEGNDVWVPNRMLRYQRALKEVFEEHWSENSGGVKLEISSLVPVSFQVIKTSARYKAIGIALKGSVA